MVINKLWKTPRKVDFSFVFWLFKEIFGFPHRPVNILVFLWITALFKIVFVDCFEEVWGLK